MEDNALSTDTARLDQAIGQVVRLAGSVEWWLRDLYASLLCTPHGTLLAAGMPVRGLSDAVKQLAAANNNPPHVLSRLLRRSISDELRDRICRAMRDVSELFDERNSVVHGMWGHDASGRSKHVVLRSRRWQAMDEWISLGTDDLDELAGKLQRVLSEVQQTAVAVSEIELVP